MVLWGFGELRGAGGRQHNKTGRWWVGAGSKLWLVCDVCFGGSFVAVVGFVFK